MAKLLDTKCLHLREFELKDAQKLFALNSAPEVMRFTGDPPFASIDEARSFLENYNAYKKTGMGRWAVELKLTGEFVGWCGLKQHEDYVDLGFRFFKKEWGKGFATEAGQACIDFGFNFLYIEEIIGRAAQQNLASIRVLEKLGMQYWKSDTCKGIENSVYYGITNAQFQSHKNKSR